ncbi:MAG TPA: response regulator [Desulfurobacteriaceae bacterium]|nr:response regulator [Desulfurobacteriaceae bacterium]
MKILLIEDIEILANLFAEMIRFYKPEAQIDVALTGKEALEKLKKEKYDVVFLDIILPDISGLEILDFINTNCPDTKVIIITAVTDNNIIKKINEYHYDEILFKPVSRDTFFSVLEKYIA